MNITFRKANFQDLPLLNSWLQKPHILEFWDNSEKQHNNMKNYLKGIKLTFDYYIGFMEDAQTTKPVPFALLLTSCEDEQPDTPEQYLPYLSKNRRTHTLDFMIGNEAYLGRGFAHQTLNEFCLFLRKENPLNTRFIIDPQATNPRAIHVYEKAGFCKMGTFIPKDGEFSGILTHVMVKDL